MKRLFLIVPIVTVCGLLLASQAEAQRPQRGGRGGGGRSADVFKFLSGKYDTNKDGEISSEEYDRSEENFKRFDTNKDGVITAADWNSQSARTRPSRPSGKSTAPSVGQQAPDITLTEILDKTKEVQLSSFAGHKPVALIFGSCT